MNLQTTKCFLIGIDPDITKSGVCLYRHTSKKVELLVELSFFALYEFLYSNRANINTVFIEAAWLNKPHWHKTRFNKETNKEEELSEPVKLKIACNTGENFQSGKKIVEMCAYLRVPYVCVRPYTKKRNIKKPEILIWFKNIAEITPAKLMNKTLTQDMVDAAMLVLGK